MAIPIFSYAVNVSTNIGICTILAPLPWNLGSATALPQNTQLQCEVLDLASYYIAAGAGSAGTVVTFQELGLDSTIASGALVPSWRPLVSPAPISLAATTNYNGILNGPFHGLRMLVSGVTIPLSFARLSSTVRMA